MSDSWDAPTVIRKGRVTSKEMKSSANINKAMASGNVEITRKGIISFSFYLILLRRWFKPQEFWNKPQ